MRVSIQCYPPKCRIPRASSQKEVLGGHVRSPVAARAGRGTRGRVRGSKNINKVNSNDWRVCYGNGKAQYLGDRDG